MHRLLAPLTAILALAYAAPARADFMACTETAEPLQVALGYWTPDRDWISQGWWTVPGNGCLTLLTGDLNYRYYYLHATDPSGLTGWESSREEGGSPFCVAEDTYLLVMREFVTGNRTDCGGDDYETVWFIEVDVGRARTFSYLFHANEGRPN
jgi:uncharacterized membrane protein